MQQFGDWERQQMSALKVPQQELIECVECGSSWMETVLVAQFDKNKIGTIGQVPLKEISYAILRCIRCGELHEPPITRVFNHPEAKKYDELLDSLQEPKGEWGGRRAKARASASTNVPDANASPTGSDDKSVSGDVPNTDISNKS